MNYPIIVLPKAHYRAWVAATKDYALRLGASLTADPDAAGRFMQPHQTIIVADLAGGYPEYGDLRTWFERHYPRLRVEYVAATSLAEWQVRLRARLEAVPQPG
jgi:hypothetical protein